MLYLFFQSYNFGIGVSRNDDRHVVYMTHHMLHIVNRKAIFASLLNLNIQ